jgi:glycosyltransferase involved in cell wall biosynthesis
MIAVITITCNREKLTKQWLSQLKKKAGIEFFHIIVDNGSKDNTIQWLLNDYFKDQKGLILSLEKNYGIIEAWRIGIKKALELGATHVVKYDDDCEIHSDNILSKLITWYKSGCQNSVIAPLDTQILDSQRPKVFKEMKARGFDARFTTHTGGIFQVLSKKAAELLINCKNVELIGGDLLRGRYWLKHGIESVYLLDLSISHRGIGKQTKNYKLK